MRIQVVAYDPAWRRDFEAEAKHTVRALGNIVGPLHHIGSTAIPGIFAKPIIAFLLEVDDIAKLDHRSATMENLGYKPMGEYGIPGRRYFHKDNHSGIRTHQVHAVNANSDNIERHLAIRHYMIAHAAEAQTYGELKQKRESFRTTLRRTWTAKIHSSRSMKIKRSRGDCCTRQNSRQ